MTKSSNVVLDEISSKFTEEVCAALVCDQRVRRKVPGGGLLHLDRHLPFLCVYRRNPDRRDAGTRQFVNGEAAYLSAPGAARVRRGLRRLVRRIAETAARRFGAFLIVELWSSADTAVGGPGDATGESALPRPGFRIHAHPPNRPEETVNALQFALAQIKLHGKSAEVAVLMHSHVQPPGARRLLSSAELQGINCHVIGLEIIPVYRKDEEGDPYPRVLELLQRGVGKAIKRAIFAFTLKRTNVRPQHFYALGRRTLPKLTWEVDRQLVQIASQLNFLLQVTPVNAESSWEEFQSSQFRRAPTFHYRPLSVDPLLLKRQLNLIATERLTDVTMSYLLRQTQDELDRLITMLSDIGTPRLLMGSIQVFGGVESSLLEAAHELLGQCPASHRVADQDSVGAREFARRGSRLIRAYRRRFPEFAATAEVREDMYSGLLVSGGNLLIGRDTRVPVHRVEALLAHEIGTHLLTYYNGLSQPLRLLSTGLAGYDALQEGLAVIAEYLVGGLSRGRLRMLAARVVAVHAMSQQRPFHETFCLLKEDYGFEARAAYTITMRVYRGGGLTKDAVYLHGLMGILDYLRRGGDMSLLWTGKIAVDHVPIVRELLLREVLRKPPLTPHFLSGAGVGQRMDSLRRGMTVFDLARESPLPSVP